MTFWVTRSPCKRSSANYAHHAPAQRFGDFSSRLQNRSSTRGADGFHPTCQRRPLPGSCLAALAGNRRNQRGVCVSRSHPPRPHCTAWFVGAVSGAGGEGIGSACGRRLQKSQRAQLEGWLLHERSRKGFTAVANSGTDRAQIRRDFGEVHPPGCTAQDS